MSLGFIISGYSSCESEQTSKSNVSKPGPKEPKHNINSFLQPLVDDLIDLWDGVILDNEYGTQEMFRAAILALSSDIPATRKCGGFVGHNAKKGECKDA